MSVSEKVILGILSVNTLIGILYFVFSYFTEARDLPLSISKTITIILFPGLGAIVWGLSWLLFRAVFVKNVDLADVVFSKEKVKAIVRADEDAERNIVSMGDALSVSEKTEVRNLLMNLAKGNTRETIAAISQGLNSSDSETSHYAASLMQDVLNDFRIKAQNAYNTINDMLTRKVNDPDEQGEAKGFSETEFVDLCVDTIEFIDDILKQQVFTDIEQRQYAVMLDEIGNGMYTIAMSSLTVEISEDIAMRLLEVKDYDRCETWCIRMSELFPDALASYSCKLKLYFETARNQEFFDTINSLKHSSVAVDKKTLEIIRTFS